MFYIIDCLQDGLQSFFWILPVKEEAIEAFHPCAKKRDRKHLLFGNITGQILTSGVSDNGPSDIFSSPITVSSIPASLMIILNAH